MPKKLFPALDHAVLLGICDARGGSESLTGLVAPQLGRGRLVMDADGARSCSWLFSGPGGRATALGYPENGLAAAYTAIDRKVVPPDLLCCWLGKDLNLCLD